MAFTCPACQAVSHHPMDEAERYCGKCHQFYDQGGMAMYPLDDARVITEMRAALRAAALREALCSAARPCPVCNSPQVRLIGSLHDEEDQMCRVDWACRACKHEWSWQI